MNYTVATIFFVIALVWSAEAIFNVRARKAGLTPLTMTYSVMSVLVGALYLLAA
jgi:hypothetical protein